MPIPPNLDDMTDRDDAAGDEAGVTPTRAPGEVFLVIIAMILGIVGVFAGLITLGAWFMGAL